MYKSRLLEIDTLNIKNIFMYFVNVGHGNTTFLIIEDEKNIFTIAIDCSIADKKYIPSLENIQNTIEHIEKKFNIKFSIDIFFLTHPHYDHYSGMMFLLTEDFINVNTEIWMNNNYQMPSSFLRNIKNFISKKKCKVILPIKKNSMNIKALDIFYPEKNIENPKYSNNNIPSEKNPNNASLVFRLSFLGGYNIIFTGDIEEEGWMKIYNKIICSFTYYCISHHGSENGHFGRFCRCARNKEVILMGRDGSYNGVYSTKVRNYFNNILYVNEKSNSQTSKFLEIDLFKKFEKYYY